MRADAERMRTARMLRIKGIIRLGSKCSDCGVKGRMEFDHLKDKSFSLSVNGIKSKLRREHVGFGNISKGWEEFVKAEVDKCQLVCHRCHCKRTASRARKLDSFTIAIRHLKAAARYARGAKASRKASQLLPFLRKLVPPQYRIAPIASIQRGTIKS